MHDNSAAPDDIEALKRAYEDARSTSAVYWGHIGLRAEADLAEARLNQALRRRASKHP